MGYTRVIYTDSTSSECGTTLKMLNFEEDTKNNCWLQMDDQSLKAYIVWGKTEYYPALHKRLDFTPRVQVHFKTKLNIERLNAFTRDTALALQNLDSRCRIRLFDPETGNELSL